jgi:hypothetical protein
MTPLYAIAIFTAVVTIVYMILPKHDANNYSRLNGNV